MTLRYVEVVQFDLQREFHRARQSTASLYSIPQLPLPSSTAPTRVDLATFARVSRLPATFSTYSNPWKIRLA